jgi:hypothetical protein
MQYDPNLYGFVYFRQIKDLQKTRKYSQKSLVLLSEHPFTSLFKQAINLIGPLFFEHGDSIFEAVNSCLKSWGQARPGQTLELPMLGQVIYFTVPSVDSTFSPQLIGDGLSDVLDSLNLGHPGLYQDINLCELFGMEFVQKFLWTFWEIFITGEDLLFLTDNPETCSFGVLALASLVSPLVYSGKVFPYFTIFDTQFRTVQNDYERKKIGETVIAGTNPYILKVFKDMTHIFQFEDRDGLSLSFQKSQAGGRYEGLMLLEGKGKELTAINNSAIRKHFRELTLSFLQVFQDYLTLDQTKLKDSPLSEHISLKSFSEQEFLSGLSTKPWSKSVTMSKLLKNFSDSKPFKFSKLFKSSKEVPVSRFMSKQKALNLYSKFIKTSTFHNWFAAQRQKASQESVLQVRKAISEFDVSRLFTLDKKVRRAYYEKIKKRIDYEEDAADDKDAIFKLKNQLQLLGQNISKRNETI